MNPHNNPNRLQYAITQLLERAGVHSGQSLPLQIIYQKDPSYVATSPTIIVRPCDPTSYMTILAKPLATLDWVSIPEIFPLRSDKSCFNKLIPVLFWGAGYEDGHKPFVERREDGAVIFYADIIAATLFMLTRWEETVVSTRDEHGRFLATSSVAYKQGFLDHPIIDEYALILREWLKVLLPGWEPQRRVFSVKLTHDVDYLRYFPTWRTALHKLGGDILKRQSARAAAQTCTDWSQQTLHPRHTLNFKGVSQLAKLATQNGFTNAAFYFMATQPSKWDNDYRLDSPLVKECIQTLRNQGFEIGLHAGYATLNNPEELAKEKARLDILLGDPHYGGRQHYLRFTVPDTWRDWEYAGLTYDSSLGYSDMDGFRCGTCHPFRPFDLVHNRVLNLWEYPLVTMDVTLKERRGLSPEQGEQRILSLAQRCKAVDGTFTLLWHNSSLCRDWEPWGQMYARVLPKLAEM